MLRKLYFYIFSPLFSIFISGMCTQLYHSQAGYSCSSESDENTIIVSVWLSCLHTSHNGVVFITSTCTYVRSSHFNHCLICKPLDVHSISHLNRAARWGCTRHTAHLFHWVCGQYCCVLLDILPTM